MYSIQSTPICHSCPSSIVFDPDGNLLIADEMNNAIRRLIPGKARRSDFKPVEITSKGADGKLKTTEKPSPMSTKTGVNAECVRWLRARMETLIQPFEPRAMSKSQPRGGKGGAAGRPIRGVDGYVLGEFQGTRMEENEKFLGTQW